MSHLAVALGPGREGRLDLDARTFAVHFPFTVNQFTYSLVSLKSPLYGQPFHVPIDGSAAVWPYQNTRGLSWGCA